MIVLDTNVISEPLKPRPEAVVVQWIDMQDPETLYLTAINLAEVLIGIALLPDGKRRRGMELGMHALQARLFAGRFLSFNREAAFAFALLGSRAAARGVFNLTGRLPDRSHRRRPWIHRRHARHPALPSRRRRSDQPVEALTTIASSLLFCSLFTVPRP